VPLSAVFPVVTAPVIPSVVSGTLPVHPASADASMAIVSITADNFFISFLRFVFYYKGDPQIARFL
jgi:hypothetical protein